MSQDENRDVPLAEALTSYINDVLRHRRDEATVIAPPTETISLPILDDDEPDAAAAEADEGENDWRAKV
jgi:hypothetical protein